MAKVFYWLKLKDDFFQQKEIKKLRKVAGGDTHTIIYLKLLLLSMKTDSVIAHEGIEEDFSEELSLVIDEEAENIKLTLGFLMKHGLIEKVEGQNYLLSKSLDMYGSETDSAERQRRHRTKKALQCNSDVTESNTLVTTSDTEKRREEKKRKEKHKDVLPDKSDDINSFFETIWILIPSHKNDVKKNIKPARRKELFNIGYDRIKIACDNYLRGTKEGFRHKRDNFFNNIIDNYLVEEQAQKPVQGHIVKEDDFSSWQL